MVRMNSAAPVIDVNPSSYIPDASWQLPVFPEPLFDARTRFCSTFHELSTRYSHADVIVCITHGNSCPQATLPARSPSLKAATHQNLRNDSLMAEAFIAVNGIRPQTPSCLIAHQPF